MWKATAPSNIALIKYMGKEPDGVNRAVNPSLSMSLSAFVTTVEIEPLADSGNDQWELLPGCPALPEAAVQRFLRFFSQLKEKAGVSASFRLRSGNNFPSDAGLASSASSFAALTKAAFQAFTSLSGRPCPPPEELAMISRTGSGSSCRSFFAPWCAWEGERIFTPPSKLPPLVDLVAVLTTQFKKISSSEAHKRVQSSPLFEGRSARASTRMLDLKAALATGNFPRAAEISWAELWDMHSLFHTSDTPFFYLLPESVAVLRWAEDCWERRGAGPIATVDAGPNVHLLVPLEEKERYRAELLEIPGVKVLESEA